MKHNPWNRKGLFYIAKVQFAWYEDLVITRKLDFVAYHLIKYFHGELKLIEMAYVKPMLSELIDTFEEIKFNIDQENP